jgi:GTP-binding protein
VHKVLDTILEVERERVKRIPTSQINDALEAMVQRLQPPQAAGNEVRLIYASQVETAPPSIAVFGNHPDLVAEHYIRYLHNGFRERYGFIGSPLRILMRSKSAPATDHRRVRA